MGQLLAKFKIWRKKNQSWHETTVQASPKCTTHLEQRFSDVQTERPEAGQQSIDELFKKLELFEVTLEKQQKILQEHNIKIKEMKDAVAKVDRGIQVDIGQWVEALQLKLNGYELRLNEQGENQRKMKKELEEQAQIQQNLHENLMAGVIVNFMIMVVICMLPRALLTSV
ncbi:unnamed protein product [Porites evermanni]|uniref:Uncharacterized protein n=1 Tax=Porites evermanni TaxID=104178 RepID=A0ABN8RL77_9CNID|nr:unnamed protein product [Porites evermanni]